MNTRAQPLHLWNNAFKGSNKATSSPRHCKRCSICCPVCPSVGYMIEPVCSAQQRGLYKGHGCISDVMITAALYPPLIYVSRLQL